MCFAPLILAGVLLTQNYSGSVPKTNLDGGMIEAQTCERGAGLDVKASTSGLYGLALQYGYSLDFNGWTVTATPKAGLAYVDHQVKEQKHPGNFEVGGQVLFGRDRWRIGLEYWHISNAYTAHPNSGLDLLMIQTGWTF